MRDSNSFFIHFSFYFVVADKLICAVFNFSLNCFISFLSSHVFFYQLIKYRIISKLIIINNEIAIKNKQFKNTVVIVKWCRNVKNDEMRIERLKVVKDIVFKQQKMLKNFATEFMQHIQHDLQFLTIVRHKLEWQNFIIIAFNIQ